MAGGVIRSVPADPTRNSSRRWSAPSNIHPEAIGVVSAIRQSDRDGRLARFLQGSGGLRQAARDFRALGLAYAEVYFEGERRRRCCRFKRCRRDVEFTSLSKPFRWPLAHGLRRRNERLCAALARVKSYLDYGAFTPIQVAAATALNGPDDCIKEMRAIYKKRAT